jgi:hypothetical protein
MEQNAVIPALNVDSPPSSLLPRGGSKEDIWSYDRIHHALARVYKPVDDAGLAELLR